MTLRKRIYIILGMIFTFFAAVLLWFQIPYSPLKEVFVEDVRELVIENCFTPTVHNYQKEDFAEFPKPVREYIDRCGYIGKPKMNYIKMEYRNAYYLQKPEGPERDVNYIQYNFVKYPDRIALVEGKRFGIPFEGCDRYRNGIGSVQGLLGKSLMIFEDQGPEIDRALLATILAESLFIPSMLLQDYIHFEPVDDYTVRGKIQYGDDEATGIFRFNEAYEMISFTTEDHAMTDLKGNVKHILWTAKCSEYRVSENGILQPTRFRAVWNLPEGDQTYFDGTIHQMTYGY